MNEKQNVPSAGASVGVGGLKVPIKQFSNNSRPKTADQPVHPILTVQIPHYRLGSPRFSSHGTAILHSSVYTQTSTNEEMMSSAFSQADLEKIFPMHSGLGHTSTALAPSWHLQRSPHAPLRASRPRSPSNLFLPQGPIEASMYDALTFPPSADDPSIVRFSQLNRSIVAATPPRLIAQITSPSFLDYDLLSDFFLTFRCFMPSSDLVAYLMARLEWAASRHDEIGKIVTVRTFVAMRHWILNYFVDDFVPDYSLRTKFCDLLNQLCVTLRVRGDGVVREGKIIGELKKCWRRTCALYWDGPSWTCDDHEDKLHPGGPPGSPDEQATLISHVGRPTINAVPAQLDAIISRESARNNKSEGLDQRQRREIERLAVTKMRQQANVRNIISRDPISRAKSLSSDLSMPVLSCSFPAKGFRRADQTISGRNAVHPIAVDLTMAQSRPHHMVGPAVRGRQPQAHKRSGSFSDALRDRRAPLPEPKSSIPAPQMLLAIPFAPSLIRGNRLPPTPPFVLSVSPPTPALELRFDSFPFHEGAEFHGANQPKPSTTYAPGMRRLLGSMRRALSHKDGGEQEFQRLVPPIDANHVKPVSNRTLGRQRFDVGGGPLRVDLLAATIVEAFKAAIHDAKEMEARDPATFLNGVEIPSQEPANQQALSTVEASQLGDGPVRQSQVTQGSKSIVIFDDTGSFVPVMMSAPLPMVTSEMGNTPYPHVESESPFPSPGDMDMIAGPYVSSELRPHPHGEIRRSSSLGATRPNKMDSLMSDGANATHSITLIAAEQVSPGTKPRKSYSFRRWDSFQSKTVRPVTEHSFDATTVTGTEVGPANEGEDGPPARMLRRRPGGNLRAAQKVTELRHLSGRHSVGSLTARSESLTSSIVQSLSTAVAGAAGNELSREPRRRFSLGALAEVTDRRSISLMRTRSSQPNLRPSFEFEVAKLAQLPDDEADDGGVESTLLKLEGKYERRNSEQTSIGNMSRHSADSDAPSGEDRGSTCEGPGDGLMSRPSPPAQEEQVDDLCSRHQDPTRLDSLQQRINITTSVVESEDSYSSTPILERGLSQKSSKAAPFSRLRQQTSTPTPLMPETVSHSNPEHVSLQPSVTIIKEAASLRTISRQSLDANQSPPQGSFLLDDDDPPESFLLDDDQDLSDLSSELSVQTVAAADSTSNAPNTFPRVTSGTVISEIGVPFHPLRHPPSPPPTSGQTPSMPLDFKQGRLPKRPPTPESSPVDRAGSTVVSLAQRSMDASTGSTERPNQSANSSAHLPFILGHDSELLAQQFTLLEKDALNEIDWKELVELHSNDSSLDTRNWFKFLKTRRSKGVDVVIARFNVMVKWALSEVVMTQDVEERARTISKYIHISAHARALRNYATMFQLMTAISSTDCSRLKQAWRLVPAGDVQTFNELEVLVQPVRNFHKLRVEMEAATVEDGCIPFLGVYVHDLVFNSQRPSQVEGVDGGPPLVNFERYRTTAAVVKNLLRLLEASSRYNFEPVEGVTDKCLWMAALSDEEIRSRSKALEPPT